MIPARIRAREHEYGHYHPRYNCSPTKLCMLMYCLGEESEGDAEVISVRGEDMKKHNACGNLPGAVCLRKHSRANESKGELGRSPRSQTSTRPTCGTLQRL